MPAPDLSEVHLHLSETAIALARAALNADAGDGLLPLARRITDAQDELMRVTRRAKGESGGGKPPVR